MSNQQLYSRTSYGPAIVVAVTLVAGMTSGNILADYKPSTFEQPVREFLAPGKAPSVEPTKAAVDRWGHRYVIAKKGAAIEQPNGGRYVLTGANGLPVEKLTCVAAAANGDVWFGSREGAVRWRGGKFEYYASKRWLPNDRVEAIMCLPDGSVYLYTPGGVSHIYFKTMTLADKADHYEKVTDARHKRYGYVTGSDLAAPGDLSTWQNASDDNDGLWTAMYVAAESFRYAVTKSPDAKRKARESFRAILELEKITGIPGFFARARVHKSEPEFGTTRGGEWHKTADGEWEWKGDTSSDEMDGHCFVWGIYYDLVADENEKAEIRAVVRRVVDRIIDKGFYLVDVDGKPTRWGVWAPERLNDDLEWFHERGLNSLEMLCYLKVARHITGDDKYEQVARELIEKHHYALNTINQKTMPGDFPGADDNHSDDELAFLAYYGLLKYEKDPQLRAIYLASIERSWQIERPEKNALFNFIYGSVTGRACDVEAAVETLREIPLDLIEWKITNSHRKDLRYDPKSERFGERQLFEPLSWRERPLHKWNGNPYRLDSGNDRKEECPTFWLLPYWMGRYYGMIGQ